MRSQKIPVGARYPAAAGDGEVVAAYRDPCVHDAPKAVVNVAMPVQAPRRSGRRPDLAAGALRRAIAAPVNRPISASPWTAVEASTTPGADHNAVLDGFIAHADRAMFHAKTTAATPQPVHSGHPSIHSWVEVARASPSQTKR